MDKTPYGNRPIKLDVPIEEFFMLCLMMFGEPYDGMSRGASRAYYFIKLEEFLTWHPRGQIFMHCVQQCSSTPSRWKCKQLHQLYAKWYRRENRRGNRCISQTKTT